MSSQRRSPNELLVATVESVVHQDAVAQTLLGQVTTGAGTPVEHISYIITTHVATSTASNDLLVQHQRQQFLGERFEYCLATSRSSVCLVQK